MFDDLTTFKANELEAGVLEFMFAQIRGVGDEVFLAHQDGEFHCFRVSLDDAERKQKVVTLNSWDFLGDFDTEHHITVVITATTAFVQQQSDAVKYFRPVFYQPPYTEVTASFLVGCGHKHYVTVQG